MLKKEFLLQNKTQVEQMYIQENKTVEEVSRAFNCSTSVLQRFLREQGISKRKPIKLEDLPSKEKIQELLDKGLDYSEICKQLAITNIQLSKILEIGRFSNKIDETIIDENSPLLWYLLGIIASDGHNDRGNSICIFQKDGTYLNSLKTILGHNGTLYKNGDGYVLKVNSPKLNNILNRYNIQSDKRYSVPYIKAPTRELESCFIRGLFDGDGCIYYNYVSGSFKNIRMEITTGSKDMVQGIENLYNELGLNYTLDERTSSVGNIYYVIYVRSFSDMEALGRWIYSNPFEFKLSSKYIKFVKFLKLVKLNMEVDDIVGTN